MKKFLSIIAFALLLTVLVACGDKPEEILASAKDELVLNFATGDSATSVTQDLQALPSTIGEVVITWKSSNTANLSNDGKVTRGMADVNVTLEATLTFNDQTLKVPFTLTIKAGSLSSLVEAFEASFADTIGDDEFEATANLNLVTTFDGATVTWTSNNTDIITNAGVVTRPAYADGDQTVILTATIVKGLLNAEVEFLVAVPKLDLTIQEKLQQALAVVTAFPVVEGISTNQEFLTTAKDSQNNEYTVVWTSSHPDILSAAGVVNQPTDEDTVVTMTASITSGDVTVTKTITFNVFKKVENTVIADTIADAVLAADGTFVYFEEERKEVSTLPFIFKNLTILGRLTDSYIATDGTDLIMIFSTAIEFEIGAVYDIHAAIQNYYAIYELIAFRNIALTATEVEDATPAYPTPETVESISAWMTAQPKFNEDVYFDHAYLSVTGRVHVQTGLGNYDTYLVSPDWADWNNSAVKLVDGTTFATPALMAYYKSNIDALRALNGKVVTINVMIQSWRTDKLVWYFNFMGTADDIEVVLNDAESVDAAETQIKGLIQTQYLTSTVVELPETLYGATIEWSSSNETAFNSTTGAVTAPDNGVATATITAVITKNDADKTVEIEVSIGDIPLIDIADLYDSESTIEVGHFIKVKGLLVAQNSTSSWWIQDATGGLNIYVPSALRDGFAAYQVGIEVQITGKFGKNNGLYQIGEFTADDVEIINNTPAALHEDKDITAVEFTNEALFDYMGQLVSFEGYVLKETVTATSGYINIVLVNPLTGAEIPGFLHTAAKGYAAALANIKEFVAGDTVNVDGIILGWNNNNYQVVITGEHFSAGTDYTEAQLAAYAESKLVVPAANAVVEANLTLPTTGLFGSTVVWTSTVPGSITTAGVVTRGDNDVAVTLGYTLTLGGVELTEKTIAVTVAKVAVVPKDLFISEYIEGNPGNRKAIEIYNGTGATVNLANYRIKLGTNGAQFNADAANGIALPNFDLANGETYVIYNDDSTGNDKLAPYGDLETSNLNFNGDDVVGLFKDNVLIDIFGIVGPDPGDGWAMGDTANATKDSVIIRNANIQYPSTTWNVSEWTRLGAYADGTSGSTTLGVHVQTVE